MAWAYDQPLWDAERVKARIAFFNERVLTHVDGVAQDLPVTQWSR